MPLLTTQSARGYGFGSASTVVINSFESIASTSLTSATSSIVFSSIPTNFTHLQIRGIVRLTAATNQKTPAIRMNGASALGSYRTHTLISKASTPSSYETGPTTMLEFYEGPAGSQASGVFGAVIIDILDYRNTNKNKVAKITYGMDNANANGSNTISVFTGVYNSTSAITEVSLIEQGGTDNYAVGTTWSLYGIKGA
jgi:hypothetical protein